MSYIGHPHAGLALKAARPPYVLFLLLAASFFFSYHDITNAKRGIDNYNLSQDDLVATVNGSPVHHIALLSLGAGTIFILLRHRAKGRVRIDGPLGWFLLSFVVWAFVSPIWAEDLTVTLQRLAGFGVLCIAAVAVVRRFSLPEIILWTFFSTALFLLIGIVLEVIFGTFRPFTSGYRFAGSLHPNLQGIDCGLLLLSAVAAADVERRWRAMFLACAFLGFVFLILSGSRTALAAAVLALVILFCSIFIFGGALSFSGLKSAVLLGRDDPATVDSFTGRTMIWEDVGSY